MPKFNYTYGDWGFKCPYCKNEPSYELTSYSEGTEVRECENCGKKFSGNVNIEVNYYSEPDCKLNGEEHQWELKEFRSGSKANLCSICGKTKHLDT